MTQILNPEPGGRNAYQVAVSVQLTFYLIIILVYFYLQGIASYEWSKTSTSPAVGDMQVSSSFCFIK